MARGNQGKDGGRGEVVVRGHIGGVRKGRVKRHAHTGGKTDGRTFTLQGEEGKDAGHSSSLPLLPMHSYTPSMHLFLSAPHHSSHALLSSSPDENSAEDAGAKVAPCHLALFVAHTVHAPPTTKGVGANDGNEDKQDPDEVQHWQPVLGHNACNQQEDERHAHSAAQHNGCTGCM